MSRASNTVYLSLKGFIIAETDKAILFDVTSVSGTDLGQIKREWFPLSQVSKITRASKQAEPGSEEAKDTICAAEWLCAKKNLSEDEQP
jgi:hypothetical protein